MKNKRQNILVCILLILVFSLLFKHFYATFEDYTERKKNGQSLPGDNKIKSVKVFKEGSRLYANIDYFFNGAQNYGYINVYCLKRSEITLNENNSFFVKFNKIEIGNHSLKVEIERPASPTDAFTTEFILFKMGYNNPVEYKLNYPIDWPDTQKYYTTKDLETKTPKELLNEATNIIDGSQRDSESLLLAKLYLDKAILADPNLIDAYPQFARIALGNYQNTAGFHDAEQYLLTALSINPDHSYSHILLGHVYTLENKFKEAENEFNLSKNIDTENLWLWTNWGNLKLKQKKIDEAKKYFLIAITATSHKTNKTNARAKMAAYSRLIDIYTDEKNINELDKVYKQRTAEYPNDPCFSSKYASFKLYNQSDYTNAIIMARDAIKNGCSDDTTRETLGLAYYLAMDNESDLTKKVDFERLAKTLFPVNANLYRSIAKIDSAPSLLRKLGAKNIDVKNQQNLSALALALMENDIESASRLINAGADINLNVDANNYPLALIPIFNQSVSGIKLLLKSGLDINQLNFNGHNALDFAKQTHNKEIIDLIESKKKPRYDH